MFAERRELILRDGTVIETPLLLPSFSSKTSPHDSVEDTLEYISSMITEEILISAYDLYYGAIKRKLRFPSVVFMDSGGYEASEDADLSDPGKHSGQPRPWKTSFHQRVLEKWDYTPATVLVSFDSPTAKRDIGTQIRRASRLVGEFPRATHELLFKTENKAQGFLPIDKIVSHKHDLARFAVVGVTEKELGPSLLDRMINIARIRTALRSADLNTPIHVFGSLDTVSTPLYFLAGADIFDGLTWLRYAFQEGETVYKHNYGAKFLGADCEDFKVNARVWHHNYYYMLDLRTDMRKYLHKNDIQQFRYNSKVFESIWAQFVAEWDAKSKGVGRNGR